MIKVFTAEWCANCTSLKKALEGEGFVYEEVDVDTLQGAEQAKEMGVRSLPFLYAQNQYGSELKGSGMIMAKGLKEFFA